MKGPAMNLLAMKRRNLRAMLAGISLIIFTNAIVLAGIAYNRSGEPETTIILTERELNLPYRYGGSSENSGIALRVNFRVDSTSPDRYRYYGNDARWLSKEKLSALGFDVSEFDAKKAGNENYPRQKAREVILVLEYNGEAYHSALAAAQKTVDELKAEAPTDTTEWRDKNKLRHAETNLEHEYGSASRLFVIDAGLDQQALRKQYPDNRKYLLLKGLVGVRVSYNKNEIRTVNGYIRGLSVNTIHVPLEHHKVLETVMAEDVRLNKDEQPRYEVKLNIGKRLEPWVVGVKVI